nr:matrix metalloproteinase-14 [Ciona intestinalis]|eukprot:XP_026690235.1 matrix metalloproteinase-14 [Ciona intestinalis]
MAYNRSMFICTIQKIRCIYTFIFILFIIKCSESVSNFRLQVMQGSKLEEKKSLKLRDKRDADVQFAENYLVNYGYVPPDSLKSTGGAAELHSRSKALVEMQNFLGLTPTGTFDDATLEMMKKPRCANPDKMSVESNLRKKRYVTVGSPWQKNLITYSINNFTPKLGQKLTHEAIDDAFRVWGSFVPLQFKKVDASQNPDIVTFFAEGFHNDNTNFDGVGGYLAHAFYPGSGIGGDTHFDGAEPWTLHQGPNRGNDLFLVAVHELGHALGLQHSPDVKAIMAPVYKYHDTENFQLPQDDILGIQSLYGARYSGTERPIVPTTSKPTPAITTTTTRRPPSRPRKPTRRPTSRATVKPTTEPPEPVLCDLTSYDAISFLRKELYIFKGKYMWRQKRGRNTFNGPYKITSFWPQLKNGVDAVYENPTSNKIVFFKDHLFWEFRGTQLQPKSPRHVRYIGMQNGKVDAAVWWQRNGKTYFFKGDYYWRYGVGKVEGDYPKPIDVWRGVPPNVDASFSGVDGSHNFTYFVKGTRFWTFNNWDIQVVKGALSFKKHWLHCGMIETEEKTFETAPPSAPVPAIIVVCMVAVALLAAAIAYVVWRRRRYSAKQATKTRIVETPGVPYQAGYGVPVPGREGEKTMCVTAAQQKMRWFRFSLQGRV